MKVIGKTDTEGFILTATRDELANLVGFYYAGSKGCPVFNVGTVIRVAAMYKQLHQLAANKGSIDAARKALMTVADSLALVDPILTAVEEIAPANVAKVS